MAKKPAKKPTDAAFRGYVNYELTKEEKDVLKVTSFSSEDFASHIERLNADSYTVKFSYDYYNNCFQCVLGVNDPKHANTGIFLSGRGSTPAKALKQAMFIHHTVTEGEWSEWLNKRAQEDLDD